MTKAFKNPTKFSKNSLLMFALLFGLVGGYAIWKSLASPVVVDLAAVEAEKMSLSKTGAKAYADKDASGDKAVKFTKGGSAKATFHLETPASKIKFYARHNCGSQKLSYTLDGKEIFQAITTISTKWKSYTVSASLNSGSHTLAVSPVLKASASCSPALYLDKSVFVYTFN